eukprot:gene10469-10627_t
MAVGHFRHIPLPDGAQPEGVTAGGTDDELWIACLSGRIVHVNVTTNTSTTVHLEPGVALSGAKYCSKQQVLFTAGSLSGKAYLFHVRPDPDIKTGVPKMVVVKREVVQLCNIPGLCYINDCTMSTGRVYFTDSFHPVLYSMPRWPGEHGSRNVYRHGLGPFFDTKLGQFRANGLAVLATNSSSDIMLIANTHTGNLYVVEIQQVKALDKSSAALTLVAKHQSGALAAATALRDAAINVLNSSIGALASFSSSVGDLAILRNVTKQQKKQSQALVTELQLPAVRGMVAGHLLLDGVWAINRSFVYVSDNMNNRIFGGKLVPLTDDKLILHTGMEVDDAFALKIEATLLDNLPGLKNQTLPLDTQLQDLLTISIGWLEVRAEYISYPKLHQYAELLSSLVRPSCVNCIDYFEALSVLRALGKLIKEIINEDKDDVYLPVVRRSYMAAVWTLQRSKMFKWELTHFQSNALSTMFRFDSPIWMVAHDITESGAVANATIGALDVDVPETTTVQVFSRRGFATEGRFSMWLMYGCPWSTDSRQYTCSARHMDAQQAGTNFLANERTLATEYDVPQVCSEFVNAVILREPVPHAVSLMAEVRYRYVRQLVYRHNITSWQPSAWNLTWWETLGPALVGGYSTRTLIGRASFCRSAANMTQQQLSEGMLSLLSFDLVMTLNRPYDIDMMISSLLGWPARNFSNQPAGRVRDAAPLLSLGEEDLMPLGRRLQADNSWPIQTGQYSSGLMQSEGLEPAAAPNSIFATDAGFSGTRIMLAASSADHNDRNKPVGMASDDKTEPGQDARRGKRRDATADARYEGVEQDDEDDESSDELFNAAAAALDEPLEDASHEPAVAPEVLAAAGAVEVVSKSWLEREAGLRGFTNVSAALLVIKAPMVQHTEQKSRHGAHLVKVVVTRNGINETEVWHAFPRHGFAFAESDLNRLEKLTWVDAALFNFADVLLDLDVGMLASLLDSFHYRKKMKGVASTYTACGFAGMMPVVRATQADVAV